MTATDLLALLIHDLRSPLVSILYNAELLDAESDLSEGAREIARDVVSAARAMQRTLGNGADVARSGEGKLTARPCDFDVSLLMREASASLSARTPDRRQSLAWDMPPDGCTVHADRDLVRGLVETAVELSMRHAPSGSTVSVRLSALESHVELCVKDARALSASPAVPSIGRVFCEEAVKALGGTIELASSSPKGHALTVRLPRRYGHPIASGCT